MNRGQHTVTRDMQSERDVNRGQHTVTRDMQSAGCEDRVVSANLEREVLTLDVSQSSPLAWRESTQTPRRGLMLEVSRSLQLGGRAS